MSKIKPAAAAQTDGKGPEARTGKSVERRARILDAAERLLRGDGAAEFSMRDLAEAAGVSFATPFNQFGSKAGIMQALSDRRIDEMDGRLASLAEPAGMADRVLAATDIATGVLLAEPALNRHLIGFLGVPTAEPGRVAGRSRSYWIAALDGAADLAKRRDPAAGLARDRLPDLLALGFRGCLSFWVAGEIADDALPARARAMAAALLLGFVRPDGQGSLRALLSRDGGKDAGTAATP
ncbi:TetR/AcrR family transcriptional regulator [Rhizosaccharibacter radicis]|uniref:TetR/AcrR family transcriptional regulator n=1 Tax=Rhizosaccharibacter radicis TaxID=2782605 RepID=A0ABT1VZP4_9PROT|nr:TetR/AcrR family transcriptional regulator [Acetobacteraceae bacterium KSS12]